MYIVLDIYVKCIEKDEKYKYTKILLRERVARENRTRYSERGYREKIKSRGKRRLGKKEMHEDSVVTFLRRDPEYFNKKKFQQQ